MSEWVKSNAAAAPAAAAACDGGMMLDTIPKKYAKSKKGTTTLFRRFI